MIPTWYSQEIALFAGEIGRCDLSGEGNKREMAKANVHKLI